MYFIVGSSGAGFPPLFGSSSFVFFCNPSAMIGQDMLFDFFTGPCLHDYIYFFQV